MFLHEYALLIAVGLPVAVVVGIQVYLFVCGERGTLLFPSLRPYESIDITEPAIVDQPEPEVVHVDEAIERKAA